MTTSYKRVLAGVHLASPGGDIQGGSDIPPGARIDTSAEAGGLEGFLGHVGSKFFTLTEPVVAAGLRFVTGGDLVVVDDPEAEEDPVADLKFTFYRIFSNQTEAQQKFSSSPVVDISSGSWGGTAAERFEQPVLLAPGNYRMDYQIALSENYEFELPLPDIEGFIVVLDWEEFEDNVAGVPLWGIRAFTDYDLTTGSLEQTYYEFADDFDPPVSVDVTTYPKLAGDWISALIARTITGVPDGVDRRQYLVGKGYIDGPNWGTVTGQVANGQGNIGGAIVTQQTYKQIIGRICEECRIAFDWTGPLARLIFIPDSSVVSEKTIALDMIERVSKDDPTPKLSVSYTTENAVVNRIDARWSRDYSQTGKEAYAEALSRREDTASISYIGVQQDAERFYYDWAISGAHAADTTDCWIEHDGRPRKRVRFVGVSLELLDLQRGSIINFNLTPSITIGDDPGIPDENQGFGEGGFGSGGLGGTPVIPPSTIKGETFPGIPTSMKFMIEQNFVNWSEKSCEITCLEVP